MEEFFTLKETAAKLKLSTTSLYRYVEYGLITCTRLSNNQIRFSESQIRKYLADNNQVETFKPKKPQYR
jgi:predicted site-specific integrase-resolvase